jgi:predicted alpha/beta-fold hydrolase
MEEYHRKFSAYYHIEKIVVPTLIFYCEDDQIVDRYSVGVEFENSCTTSETQKSFKIKNINNENIILTSSKYGGHLCSFESFFQIEQWLPKPAFEFFSYFRHFQN